MCTNPELNNRNMNLKEMEELLRAGGDFKLKMVLGKHQEKQMGC